MAFFFSTEGFSLKKYSKNSHIAYSKLAYVSILDYLKLLIMSTETFKMSLGPLLGIEDEYTYFICFVSKQK
ncbi:MAG: hypothetical protein ACI8ZM_000774 [Crocinitomix sp.]|jgi:hypothetical protein